MKTKTIDKSNECNSISVLHCYLFFMSLGRIHNTWAENGELFSREIYFLCELQLQIWEYDDSFDSAQKLIVFRNTH